LKTNKNQTRNTNNITTIQMTKNKQKTNNTKEHRT